jgi:hypothetical protein
VLHLFKTRIAQIDKFKSVCVSSGAFKVTQ